MDHRLADVGYRCWRTILPEYDIARNADWHRRGKMLDDMLAFPHAWWTTNPVS
jgi:hypothetical protein